MERRNVEVIMADPRHMLLSLAAGCLDVFTAFHALDLGASLQTHQHSTPNTVFSDIMARFLSAPQQRQRMGTLQP